MDGASARWIGRAAGAMRLLGGGDAGKIEERGEMHPNVERAWWSVRTGVLEETPPRSV